VNFPLGLRWIRDGRIREAFDTRLVARPKAHCFVEAWEATEEKKEVAKDVVKKPKYQRMGW